MAKKAKRPAAKKRASAKQASSSKPQSAKASAAVKPSEVKKLPPASTVKNLATLVIENQSKIGTHAGNISDAIRDAKKKGLHPAAFKLAVRLKTQAANNVRKAADFLDHLDFCLDVLGVTKLIEDAPELPMSVEGDGEKAGDEQPPVAVQSSAPAPAAKAQHSDRSAVQLGDGTILRPNFSEAGDRHLRELQEASGKPN